MHSNFSEISLKKALFDSEILFDFEPSTSEKISLGKEEKAVYISQIKGNKFSFIWEHTIYI